MTVYGQHVCRNALIGYAVGGKMKLVPLSHTGRTVCNNAWLDKIPTARMTPVCKTECLDCKSSGKIYPHFFPQKKQRKLSQTQIDNMQNARKEKSNG
jgi:hypothetical protein